MNANPPIQVAMAARRSKAVRQKVMQQMMQRSPGAASSASGGGGRNIFGSANSRLPIPHLIRASKLAPALIAALGIGGAGMPDNAVGGIANGLQSNIAAQAQGIPDWAPQPQAGATATPASGGSDYQWTPADSGAPNTGSGDLPAGTPAPNDAYTADGNGGWSLTNAAPPPAGQDANGIIHLGNGVYYDPVRDALVPGPGGSGYNGNRGV